jgi:hypothetical protein
MNVFSAISRLRKLWSIFSTLQFCTKLLVISTSIHSHWGPFCCPHFISSATSLVFLYGCHYNHELVYLDGPQRLHLQRATTLFAVGQGLLSEGVCSSYSQSKS